MWHDRKLYLRTFPRLMIMVTIAFLVSACASTLSARVTTYQQWPAGLEGATYRIVPSETQRNNLEFEAFADMIRASMGPTGLVEAQGGAPARFDVGLIYGNTVSQQWVQRYQDPYFYDGWGMMGSAWGGYYGGYHGWGGGVFLYPSVVNVPVEVYKNSLTVVITDNQNKGAEVYRSTAVNLGSSDYLASVMPYLAQAVFDGFPGNNGEVRDITYDLGRR